MAAWVRVTSMGKSGESDDSLKTRKRGAGAWRHRRRSSATGSNDFAGEAQLINDTDLQNNFRVWDCESNLYDSAEVLAFLRRLNEALPEASNSFVSAQFRSLSMPHYLGLRGAFAEDDQFEEVRGGPPDFQNTGASIENKRGPRLPWSLGKLMKGLLRRSGGRGKT